MSVRRKEIKRLIYYAKGLGLKVKFKPYERGSFTAAEWGEDFITIFTSSKTSLIEIILSLIHELGHHRDFISNGRRFPYKEAKLYKSPSTGKLTKQQRLVEWKSEIAGTKYWEQIYRDVGCSFNINILFLQMHKDLFIYEFMYHHGKFPTKAQIEKNNKKLSKLFNK